MCGNGSMFRTKIWTVNKETDGTGDRKKTGGNAVFEHIKFYTGVLDLFLLKV